MISSKASDATLKAIEAYTEKALNVLEELAIAAPKKEILRAFANMLMGRQV